MTVFGSPDSHFRNKLNHRLALALAVLVLSILSPFASHILGSGVLPHIQPVSAVLGPNNNLGIDCALGASADAPNVFPTPVTTKDSDGVIDSNCQWTGDVDGDTHAPFPTFDPLTSDNPEALTPQIGGGFIADVIFANMNTTINGFDMTLNYDPHTLDFIAFDQSGLTFGGNVGCPAAILSCTVQLANSADRVNGAIRLAETLLATKIGPNGDTGNINSVTLFRMRFDVVGAGYSAIHFGTNIITFAVGVTTGPDPHSTIDGSFSTQNIFNLINSQQLAPSSSWFNVSWSFSPHPETPSSPLNFTAAASCSFCKGPLTYNWDFSSVDSSTYVPKIDKTGSVVTITAPPPLVNRVTLTVTNGTLSVSATRLLPLAAGAPPSTLPVGALGSAARGSWLGGVPTYSGSYNLCPAQSATDISVCSKPTQIIPLGTQTQNKTVALTYNYAGAYNSTISITDSSPTQVSGPASTSTTFLVNVTGSPPAFGITLASNSSTVRAGQTIQFSSMVAYGSSYPAGLRASTFRYNFLFGDGISQSFSAGQSTTTTHKYSTAGNFTVSVSALEIRTSTVSQARIQESGRLQLGGNQTLSVDFTINPASPQKGQIVSFNATASGGTPPYSFAWNFGDGTTGVGSLATHAYSNVGTFTVTATVTDSKGIVASIIHSLTVGSPLTGNAIVGVWSNGCNSFNITNTSPTCGGSGVTLTPRSKFTIQINVTNAPAFNAFEFALYYDPHYLQAQLVDVNGSTGTPTVFGNLALAFRRDVTKPGAVYVSVVGLGKSAVFTGGSGVLANIVFNVTGTGVSPFTLATGMIPNGFDQDALLNKPDWTILANTNSAGITYYVGVGTADGYFTNVAGTGKLGPVAGFTFKPSMPSQGQQVSFDASLSFDPDNRTANAIRLYLWDFGDGGSAVTNRTSTTHFYVTPGDTRLIGNFSVRLTVIDVDNGFEGMKTQLLTIHSVADRPPIANFVFSPSNPVAGQPVTFDGSSSFDPDGSVVNASWNFGDGSFSSGLVTVHIYQSSGNFTVTLTVRDNAGLVASQSQVIRVGSRAGIPPVARFTFSPTNPATGQPVNFDGFASSDADGAVISWSWSFGDGFIGFGTFTSHTYFSSGNFTVTLTVTDTDGLSASASSIVQVHSVPPHDVAITTVQVSPTRAVSTQRVGVFVYVVNTGSQQATVNVTAYWDSHVIGSENGVTLPPNFDGFQEIFIFGFPWDTTGVPLGNHTITARVFLADDPTPADNFASGGQVTILPPPALKLVPVSGSVGTKVVIEASGFPAPQFSFFGQVNFIQVSFDNMTIGFTTTSTGSFNFTFDVPLSQPGIHYINVIDESSGAHATAAFQVLPPPGALDVTIKTAAIYFPGDTASFYVLVTLNGVQAGPSGLQLQLTLVLPNGTARGLTTVFTPNGIYKASFIVSTKGSLGTYTLVATARMRGASDGSSIASFEVKPTWLSANAGSIAGGTTIAGVIGLAAFAYRKGYFKRKNDPEPSFLAGNPETIDGDPS